MHGGSSQSLNDNLHKRMCPLTLGGWKGQGAACPNLGSQSDERDQDSRDISRWKGKDDISEQCGCCQAL